MKRRAVVTGCPRCRLAVLAGLDADTAALEALAEILPVTRQAEVIAALTGRPVYNLSVERRLYRRTDAAIKAGHNPHGEPVVVGHICDRPVPAEWYLPVVSPQPETHHQEDQPCPF